MGNLLRRIEEIAFPAKFQQDLVDSKLPNLEYDEDIDLIIVLDDMDINVRQLAYFLAFMDKVYARISPLGIMNYTRFPDRQLKINTIKEGSTILEILNVLQYLNAPNLIILITVLGFLPSLLKSLSTSVSNFAHARKELHEGTNFKLNNKILRQDLEKDKELSKLSKKYLRDLEKIISYLASKDPEYLVQAAKFIEKHVRRLSLKRHKKR